MRATIPELIVDALAIRDTTAHTPATDPTKVFFADVHEWQGWVIKVTNGLDQEVVLTLFGNFAASTTESDSYSATLTVAAGATGYITYHCPPNAWTPWIYPSLQCSVAPTSGSLTVQIVMFDKMRG